jgi:hypothetical protein
MLTETTSFCSSGARVAAFGLDLREVYLDRMSQRLLLAANGSLFCFDLVADFC